jgi:hypothetical protein
MYTLKEIDDVKVMNPDADEVTLFNAGGALAFKDENGDVHNLVEAPTGGAPKVYKAILNFTGGDGDPIATVLANTLDGTVVWTRYATGRYAGTLAGAFTTNKVIGANINTSGGVMIPLGFALNGQPLYWAEIRVSGTDAILIHVYNGSGDFIDVSTLFKYEINLEVYP